MSDSHLSSSHQSRRCSRSSNTSSENIVKEFEECRQHGEYQAKYICVEAGCREKSKIVCAECQLEGVHRKHEFMGVAAFESRVQSISADCIEYLDAKLDPTRIADSISDRFEVLRIQINQILAEIESGFLQLIHRTLATPAANAPSHSPNRLDELKESLRRYTRSNRTHTRLSGNEQQKTEGAPNTVDDLTFQINLINQKEKIFDAEIQSAQAIHNEFNHVRVDILTYLQSLVKQKTIQSKNQQPEQQEQSVELNSKNTVIDCKSVQHVIRIEDIEWKGIPSQLQQQQEEKHYPSTNNEASNELSNKSRTINGIRAIKQLSPSTIGIVSQDYKVHFVDSKKMISEKELASTSAFPLVGHNYTITGVLLFEHQLQDENESGKLSYAVTSSADTSIKLWEMSASANSKVVSNVKCHSHEVTVLEKLSSTSFVSGSKDYSVCLHEIEWTSADSISVRTARSSRFLDYAVKSIIRIGDGSMFLVVGYSNGSIVLVDRVKWEVLFKYDSTHELGLYCMAQIDEPMFLSGGGDGKLKLWTAAKQQCLAETVLIRSVEDYIKIIVRVEGKSLVVIGTRLNIEIISYASFQSQQAGKSKCTTSSSNQVGRLRLASLAKISISSNFGDILDILISKGGMNATHGQSEREPEQSEQIIVATSTSLLYIY